ncbi:hypothetical protein G7046_g6299 [Stylonectria norvegica]|nr:hypothetical protein G7046_g6299 [Stylonectria norvegica]
MELDTDLDGGQLSEEEVLKYVSNETAASRINPTITPRDESWRQTYQEFAKLLRSPKTIEQILFENFTRHEARLFIPEDREDIKRLQDENTDQYYALLEDRFKDVKPSLALKLTMMYFGLPVEPMICPLDDLAMELESREPEGELYDVQPPLHFLTAHDRRNWGKDCLRGREAPNYPTPKPMQQEPTLSLRGGGDETDDVPEFDNPDDFPGSDEPMKLGDPYVYLYGYQGRIPVVPQKWMSYATAVRQLLSLRPDSYAACRYTLSYFDVKSRNPITTVDDQLPLTQHSPAVKLLQTHFSRSHRDLTDHEGCCAFFVKLAQDPVPFDWKPQPDQLKTDLAKIAYWFLDDDPPPKTADQPFSWTYVPFPKFAGDTFDIKNFASNQYNLHLRAALGVVIGMPRGSMQQAYFFLEGTAGGQQLHDEHLVLGAREEREETWNDLHPLNKRARWQLKKKHFYDPTWARSQLKFQLVVPNYCAVGHVGDVFNTLMQHEGAWQQTCAHPDRWPPTGDPYPETAICSRDVFEDALTKDEYCKVQNIRLLPGQGALGPDIDSRVESYAINPEKGPDGFVPDDDAGMFIKDIYNAGKELYAVAYPEWKADTSFIYRSQHDPLAPDSVPLPPMQSGPRGSGRTFAQIIGSEMIDAFRKLFPRTSKSEGYKTQTYVKLRAKEGLVTHKGGLRKLNCPTIVVGPETTDEDWFRIRLSMVNREYVASLLPEDDESWRWRIPKSNVWGPRYHPLIKPAKPGAPKSVAFQSMRNTAGAPKNALPKTPVTAEFVRHSAPSVFDRTRSRGPGLRDVEGIQPVAADMDEQLAGLILPPDEENERSRTWATQPSVFDGLDPHAAWPSGGSPEIPINAAPVERVFRTTSSVPMVSLGLLTPTEQAELQRQFTEVRNIALSRIITCPFKDCRFSTRLDEQELFDKHAKEKHQSEKCNLCDEPLWRYWDQAEKDRHLREKHKEQLINALGLSVPTTETIESRRLARNPQDSSKQAKVVRLRLTGRSPVLSTQAQATTVFTSLLPKSPTIGMPKSPTIGMPKTPASGILKTPATDVLKTPMTPWPKTPSLGGPNTTPPASRYALLNSLEKRCHALLGPLLTRHATKPIPKFEIYYLSTLPRDQCNFCDLCGRDRRKFRSDIEKEHHDLTCFPGVTFNVKSTFCTDCGCHIWASQRDADDASYSTQFPHKCSIDRSSEVFPEYCGACGVNWSVLKRSHRKQHELYCKGYGSVPLKFCIHCGDGMADGKDQSGRLQNQKHMIDCYNKVWKRNSLIEHKVFVFPYRHTLPEAEDGTRTPSAVNNLDDFELLDDEDPRPLMGRKTKLVDPPRLLTRTKRGWYDAIGIIKREPNMDRCPVLGCQAPDLSGFGPAAIYDHLKTHSTRNDRWSCSYCRLEYERAHGWRLSWPRVPPREEIVLHLDCHVYSLWSRPGAEGYEGYIIRRQKKSTSVLQNLILPRAIPAEDESTKSIEKSIEVLNDDAIDVDADRDDGEDDYIDVANESNGNEDELEYDEDEAGHDEDEAGHDEDEEEHDEDEDEPSRGRRAKSPDWVAKLGPSIPSFEPDDNMYCSKCLRKAPKMRDLSPGRSTMTRSQEMRYHTNPNHCCKIRNAPGSAKNLPNHSGWIPSEELPRKLGDIKKNFLEKYPDYRRTLYPVKRKDTYATLWRSDPNNETNKAWWDIPWPPYKAGEPIPGPWKRPADDDDDDDRPRKKSRRASSKKPVLPSDPAYHYRSDEDSADALTPDVDDLSDNRKKRRRRGDTQDGSDADDQPAGQKASKKAKLTQKAPGTPRTPKSRSRAVTPTAASTRSRRATSVMSARSVVSAASAVSATSSKGVSTKKTKTKPSTTQKKPPATQTKPPATQTKKKANNKTKKGGDGDDGGSATSASQTGA